MSDLMEIGSSRERKTKRGWKDFLKKKPSWKMNHEM